MNDQLKQQLQKLAKSDTGRTLIGRLNDHYDEIEMALRSGVPVADVVATLGQNGIVLNRNTFNVYMSRLRKRRAKTITEPNEISAPPSLRSGGEKLENPSPVIKSEKTRPREDIPINEAITKTMNKETNLRELSQIAKKNRKKK